MFSGSPNYVDTNLGQTISENTPYEKIITYSQAILFRDYLCHFSVLSEGSRELKALMRFTRS